MAQAEALGRSRLGATIRGVMPTAAEVLERTKNAYATCSSYRDRGEVVTVFITGVKPYHRRTTRRPFRTAFLRPDSFYFQFRDVTVGPESEWSMYAVWAAGGRARSWSTRDERIKAHPSILEALSGPTGVSGGSAIRIPRLLIPNEHQAYSLPAPDGSTMREDALEDGTRCYVVRGPMPRGDIREHWIDSTTYLLRAVHGEHLHTPARTRELRAKARREIEERAELDPQQRRRLLDSMDSMTERPSEFTTTHTTTYEPEVDVAIASDAFELIPP